MGEPAVTINYDALIKFVNDGYLDWNYVYSADWAQAKDVKEALDYLKDNNLVQLGTNSGTQRAWVKNMQGILNEADNIGDVANSNTVASAVDVISPVLPVTVTDLFTGVVTLNARYPIYKGFGSVYTDVVKDANKLSARTSATGRNYSATASANNQKYFILIPNDISVPGTATMGGAPYVFNQSSQTISGVQYTVLTSGATYNTGATVDITLA